MDKLSNGLIVTFLGMGTVFIVLIALVYILNLLKVLIYDNQNRAKKNTAITKIETDINDVSENNDEDAQCNDDHQKDEFELVAVITAAIAASLNTSTHNIVVRSIKRFPDNIPVWNKIARQEQLNR